MAPASTASAAPRGPCWKRGFEKLTTRGPSARIAWTLVAVALAARLDAQLQLTEIAGTVVTQTGEAARGATVKLLDDAGAVIALARADDQGRFLLRRLPLGAYWLRAETADARSGTEAIRLESAPARAVVLRLGAAASESVEVQGQPGGSEHRLALAGETIGRLGGRMGARALQTALTTAPGWAGEDSGLLHHQGVDDGFLYVVDGVPVYERMDTLFGILPDAGTIGSVQVLSGYIPPEYGLKGGGVIELRSRPAGEREWASRIAARRGAEATASLSALAERAIGRRALLSAAMSAERSSRFLDPVHPVNFHNAGHQLSGEAELSQRWARDTLTLRAGMGASRYEVPHGAEQEAAGQDQRQSVDQDFQTAAWQRAWSDRTVSHAAVYRRSGESRLRGSEADEPLWADGGRTLRRLGVLGSLARQSGAHTLKAGFEAARLDLAESFAFGLTRSGAEAGLSEPAEAFTRADPFRFAGAARRWQSSFYAQDSWRPASRFSLDLGMRFDRTRLPLAESQWSPRLGLAFTPERSTTLRAAVNRFYQPPQAEWLLLSSSAQARGLSPFAEQGGGADVLAERQTAFELLAERRLGTLGRLELSLWHRRFRNQADPNVFFGTTVVFPNSVARGRARGIEARIEFPRRGRWSGSAGYTLAEVVQFGPVNGGLFLEDDIIEIGPGMRFTPDHDHRHSAAGTIAFDDEARGVFASILGRFQTGTPLEVGDQQLDELRARPGADLVDFDAGRVLPRLTVDLALHVRAARTRAFDFLLTVEALNVTDDRYAFNFGNPFSGTHFGPPRTLAMGLRAVSR
jgi:hypothetical protein